jgi:hypothetical protein
MLDEEKRDLQNIDREISCKAPTLGGLGGVECAIKMDLKCFSLDLI